MSKQDRQGVRTPADLERRYGLTGMKKSFAEVLGVSKGTSASTDRVLTELVGLKKTVQKELSRINNTIDSLPARDTLDATRLAVINAALEENGVEAVASIDDVDEAIPEVHAAGVQSEYDRFWDEFQDYGKRTHYSYGFSGNGWTNKTFKPKYDIIPSAFTRGMAHMWVEGSLTKILEQQGVVLDTSNVQYPQYVFDSASFLTEIPNIVGNYSIDGLFLHCSSLISAEVTVKEITGYGNATFQYCTSLTNLKITGTIGQSGLNFQWSTKLSRASIESVITALSSTATGKSITFSEAAVNNAFETSTGAADGSTSEAWTTLIGTRANWTISLV